MSEILVICHTELLWTTHILHTELSLGMLWGSHCVQQSLCSHSVNMLAQLLDCTITEQYAVIQLLWTKKGKG
jgi:hypothetical protein